MPDDPRRVPGGGELDGQSRGLGGVVVGDLGVDGGDEAPRGVEPVVQDAVDGGEHEGRVGLAVPEGAGRGAGQRRGAGGVGAVPADVADDDAPARGRGEHVVEVAEDLAAVRVPVGGAPVPRGDLHAGDARGVLGRQGLLQRLGELDRGTRLPAGGVGEGVGALGAVVGPAGVPVGGAGGAVGDQQPVGELVGRALRDVEVGAQGHLVPGRPGDPGEPADLLVGPGSRVGVDDRERAEHGAVRVADRESRPRADADGEHGAGLPVAGGAVGVGDDDGALRVGDEPAEGLGDRHLPVDRVRAGGRVPHPDAVVIEAAHQGDRGGRDVAGQLGQAVERLRRVGRRGRDGGSVLFDVTTHLLHLPDAARLPDDGLSA